MSLARAIATGDLAELPSRRDEDWRWTDLRGLIRAMPPASPASEGPTPPAVFAAETQLRVINGRGPDEVTVGAGETRTLALRFIAASSGTAHVSAIRIVVGEGARLTLLETYEALAGGCLAEADLDIDALRIVAEGVNALRAPDRSMLVITHYQRLLDYIRPDRVHVLVGGRIVDSGGPELALQLEREGYDRYGVKEAA